MSMNTYPVRERGALVITGALTVLINSQYYQTQNSPADMTPDELTSVFGSDSDARDALEDKDIDGLCYCSEFEGSASPLKTFDDTEDHDVYYADEYLVYITMEKEADLFSAAYAGFDELVDEYRRKLEAAGFDLTGFPLENYVCEVNGTYIC